MVVVLSFRAIVEKSLFRVLNGSRDLSTAVEMTEGETVEMTEEGGAETNVQPKPRL
ncbi:MAG: hypothetical protein BWY14_00540 [Parcubacteria group bacterium ADurb.Bin192]|nr:MAG: hypothetical protein BWY14_00540 [Parcubacteria group bacterium ADurb.Bin192]